MLFVYLQLLPLLEKALENPSLQNGPLFLLVTEMLVSWEKRAGLHGEDEANDSKDVFQGLLADFWEGLGLLFVRYADDEDADPRALEGVATLLQVSLLSKVYTYEDTADQYGSQSRSCLSKWKHNA